MMLFLEILKWVCIGIYLLFSLAIMIVFAIFAWISNDLD